MLFVALPSILIAIIRGTLIIVYLQIDMKRNSLSCFNSLIYPVLYWRYRSRQVARIRPHIGVHLALTPLHITLEFYSVAEWTRWSYQRCLLCYHLLGKQVISNGQFMGMPLMLPSFHWTAISFEPYVLKPASYWELWMLTSTWSRIAAPSCIPL